MSGFSFTPTKRGNACPICTDAKGNCRETGEDVIFCHSFIDGNVPSWKYLGMSKCGVWGMFLPEGSDNGNWQDAQDRRNQQRQQRERDRQAKHSDGLTIVERDANARKLLQQCPLRQEDRANLIARGIPAEQLQYFGSVFRGKLVLGISEKFPGVFTLREGGQAIALAKDINSGILCPSFSPGGLITGFQIRVSHEVDANKYRWLKARYSSHLINGELPLSYIGDANSTTIQFCEGILKPFVIGTLTCVTTVGASGGNFVGSPAQLSKAIAGKQSAILIPDAGAITNNMVMLQYFNLQQYLAGKGIPLSVAWWGQNSKDALDGDDLLAAGRWGEASVISWQQFISLASPEMREYLYPTQPKDSELDQAEPDPADYAEECRRQEEEEAFAKAQREEERKAWVDQAPLIDRNRWLRGRKFTPTVTINSRYFEWGDADNYELIGIKAGLGGGKTQWLIGYLSEHTDNRQMLLGYRNQLLIQTIERANKVLPNNAYFLHMHDEEAFLFHKAADGKIAACVDSLWKFQLDIFDGAIICIDEIESVLEHLLNGRTCQGKRDALLDIQVEAIKRAGKLIVLDGNLTDRTMQMLQVIRGTADDRTAKVFNTCEPPKRNIRILLGSESAEGELHTRDMSEMLREINALALEGIPFVVQSDSQKQLEAIEQVLVGIGIEPATIWRIDSKTTRDKNKDIEWFMKNPDAFIAHHQPKVLLLSPTIESGADISIRGYWKKAFYQFYGVIALNSILQMIGRLRDEQIPRDIWCTERGIIGDEEFKPFKASAVAKLFEAYQNQLGAALIVGCSPEDRELIVSSYLAAHLKTADHPLFDYSCELSAQTNYERSNLRECLIYLLKQSDNVTEATGDNCVQERDDNKDAKKEVKLKEATEKFNAKIDDLTDNERRTLEKGMNLSWTDQCKAAKLRYLSMLPGIEEEKVWSPEFIYETSFVDRHLIRKAELLHLLNAGTDASEGEQLWWLRRALDPDVGAGWMRDISSKAMKVEALRRLGVLELIGGGGILTKVSPELLELSARGKNSWIANALGFRPGADVVKYLSKLLGLIGMKLKSHRLSAKERGYSIDTNQNDIQEAISRCISRRWEERLVRERDRVELLKAVVATTQEQSPPEAETTQLRVTLPSNVYILAGSDTNSETEENTEITGAKGTNLAAFCQGLAKAGADALSIMDNVVESFGAAIAATLKLTTDGGFEMMA